MTTSTNTTTTTTTTLFTNAAAAGYTPIRGLRGVCARIKCLSEGCIEQAFIFKNEAGKVINACTCGWRRIAPAPKKWGKPANRTPRPVDDRIDAIFAIKKAAALAAAAIRAERLKEQAEFKPDMS